MRKYFFEYSLIIMSTKLANNCLTLHKKTKKSLLGVKQAVWTNTW